MGVQAFVPRSLEPEPSRLAAGPRGRQTEAFALLLFAAAVFLALSLGTLRYDPDDPTFAGADWMGEVGAFFARILVQGFGAAAWLVAVELLFVGAPLFKGRRPPAVGLRAAGDVVLLVLVSALLQVVVPDWEVFGHGRSGGNVGLFFGELMRGLFSAPGSLLVGFTGVGLILIGRSSFSFIQWCERGVAFEARLRESVWALLCRVGRAFTTARQLRRAEQPARPNPTIEERDPDAVILHHLEDDAPWIPMEVTGRPPIALSESLRRTFGPEGARSRQAEADGAFDPAVAHFVGAATFPDPQATPGAAAEADDFAWLANGPGTGAESAEAGDPTLVVSASVRAAGAQQTASARPSREPQFTLALDSASVGTALVGDLDGFFDKDGLFSDEQDVEDAQAALVTNPVQDALAEVSPSEVSRRAGVEAVGAAPRIVARCRDAEVRLVGGKKAKATGAGFLLPSTDLLETAPEEQVGVDRAVILANAELLEKTLADYGVTGRVEEIHPGPTVTTYEVAPAAGTKVSKVAGLSDDLALGLSRKVRIIAPIPGKSRIGFELPNDERQPVNLRELVEDERFEKLSAKAPLPVVLGRDIVGAPFYADLASMPHVIVAGATGAGKSVGLNVMLSSLLFRRTPEELRLLMIDPKVVELAPFDRIPHLLLPVVTDMKQAAQALKWAVDEMERRYQLFADAGTKNITTYNRYVQRVLAGDLPPPRQTQVEAVDHNGDLVMMPASKNGSDGAALPENLPYIVIVVDEFADLIMQQGKEVESAVARLAQKARAAGMHVILATQRPSVDVITGMIKANFPTRIAFRVAQKVDSRTILDEQGAEVLLGRGDMLVKLNGATDTRRVQCPFISEEEVSLLTDHLRAQGEPQYQESILEQTDEELDEESPEKEDNRFDEAVLIVRETGRCSTSWLQRKMTIGYNRAAKIVEMMERRGYVGPPNGSRDREVFIPPGSP